MWIRFKNIWYFFQSCYLLYLDKFITFWYIWYDVDVLLPHHKDNKELGCVTTEHRKKQGRKIFQDRKTEIVAG
jgi:hypothetical protein